MSRRALNLLASASLAVLMTTACQEAPVGPLDSAAPLFARGGNSDAAHACQDGGYANLFRTDGTGFANVGECVSYAAHGGVLARQLTARFTNIFLTACNELSWGVEVAGVVGGPLGGKAGGCFDTTNPDASVTYLSTQTIRVYLRDVSCGFMYFEGDNHSVVTGTNPADIKISDAGGFCESPPGDARPPGALGNLNVTRTIS